MQAEGGRALAARHPERAGEVLGTIAETGREALTETRRILGVLRDGRDGAGTAYGPQPGLADIADLVRRTSDRAELATFGTPPALSPAVGLTAYRVVQESLTNVLKHAGPEARARVVVACTADAVEIEVADDGRRRPPCRTVRATGCAGWPSGSACTTGELSAGPGPNGGFVVRAWIPYERAVETRADLPPGGVVVTRVFLVDDQALVRGGFRMLIEAEDDLEVVGEASDGQEALTRLRTTPADVVLMDVRMPVMDGVEATRRLLADGNPARVLVLTTFDLDEYVFAALKAGRERLPAQGRPPRRAALGHPRRRRGRRRDGAERHPRLLDHVSRPCPASRRAATTPASTS